MDYIKESDLLKVLGHPIRLRIISGLIDNECNVNKMVKILKIPQSTVSQHLGLLKARGIVEVEKDGVKSCYRVVDNRVKKIIKILGE